MFSTLLNRAHLSSTLNLPPVHTFNRSHRSSVSLYDLDLLSPTNATVHQHNKHVAREHSGRPAGFSPVAAMAADFALGHQFQGIVQSARVILLFSISLFLSILLHSSFSSAPGNRLLAPSDHFFLRSVGTRAKKHELCSSAVFKIFDLVLSAIDKSRVAVICPSHSCTSAVSVWCIRCIRKRPRSEKQRSGEQERRTQRLGAGRLSLLCRRPLPLGRVLLAGLTKPTVSTRLSGGWQIQEIEHKHDKDRQEDAKDEIGQRKDQARKKL